MSAQGGDGAAAPGGGNAADQRRNGTGGAAPPTTTQQSTQNLNQIVTDYLLKRGFTRTEEVFRKESAHLGPDGKPQVTNTNDMGPKKYTVAFRMLRKYVESTLDYYKHEMNKFLWPVFVHSYLCMIQDTYSDDATTFFDTFKDDFKATHADDLKLLATIKLPSHIEENPHTKAFRSNKYRIAVTNKVHDLLIGQLEKEYDNGGLTILHVLVRYCLVCEVDRDKANPYSFAAIVDMANNLQATQAETQEGVSGALEGIRSDNIPTGPLKLGSLPMDAEYQDEVRHELLLEDQRNPPPAGKPSLLEEFEQKIKREESTDCPARTDLPLPPPRAKDVWNEVEKIREYRDRFPIEKARTGGVGPAVTICMYTFHNTHANFNCIDFSGDLQMVAVGSMDSYIRVWSTTGAHLPHTFELLNPTEDVKTTNNRLLIGHSGPVMSVSFSETYAWPDHREKSPFGKMPRMLLSSSADGSIRLWNLDTWCCLTQYKGHMGPVWNVKWGPHGHYFASGGRDKVLRIWAQDHVTSLRDCVGHDDSISAITWHPNGLYVFSASDQTDKSIRMWSVTTGDCVRILTGHTADICTMECAPNGRILASADWAGNIFFWDFNKGTLIKKSRGHAKTGILSLSFSAESTVLVSGGLDGTVRVWDVEGPADGSKTAASAAASMGATMRNVDIAGDSITVGGAANQATPAAAASSSASGSANAGAATGASGNKKKGKEALITADQISAFPTKKTPLKRVKFSRMNLIVAAGCFDPDN